MAGLTPRFKFFGQTGALVDGNTQSRPRIATFVDGAEYWTFDGGAFM